MRRATIARALGVLALLAAAELARAGDVPLRLAQSSVRAIDGVTVDVDASSLRDSSNLRLIVVAASTPDEISDVQALYLASVGIHAGRVRLTLPGGPAGNDEVRLYHVPRLASTYAIAARAPVIVASGVPGAAFVRDLASEAALLGAIKFDATHRDARMLVQAQFLGARPESEWDEHWYEGGIGRSPGRPVAVIRIGTRGVSPTGAGVAPEMECLIDVEGASLLERVAALNPGDAVLMRGSPSAWSVEPGQPLTLNGCELAD
jgi:hypothetical protein